jgi:NADH dehydrogenase
MILERLAGGEGNRAFAYNHAGDLATIGKRSAVIDFGRIKLRGALAWWVWGIAHIYFLVDLKNRVFVTLNWLWIYLTGQHRNRLITHGQAPARAPIKEVTEGK